jgi:sulfite exporter TauE/SafE
VITALLLGLMGSLHCAGMCGPLVLLTPVKGSSRTAIVLSRALYHTGRIAMYAGLGLIFGLIGESILVAGSQRWLSLGVGVLMLVVLFAPLPFGKKAWRIPMLIKSRFGKLLREPTWTSIFALGVTNGLLPCGLVYMAATAAIAAGCLVNSVLYMTLFGLGTLPMLLTISVTAHRIKFLARPGLQKLVPFGVAIVALILIVRSDPVSLIKGGTIKSSCPACER